MKSPTSNPITEHRPLDWFKTDDKELGRHDDPDAIRRQGEDMLAKGQLQPVAATEDGRMIFGHGRWLSAKAIGIKTLETRIYPASLPETQFKLIRAAENLHRKELSSYRKGLLCADLMRCNSDWQLKDLAEHLHLDPSMLTRLLSPSKCIEAAQHALRDGKIGISDCYAISKVPEGEQAALLAMKLAGASRDAIEHAGRTRRTRNVPAVKLSRVKCPLTSGVVIVASGEALSLDDLIDALGEAQKEAKKAREQGLDAKTFQAVMRDRAKAR
jgi:ParB family chromosome partitioning protein